MNRKQFITTQGATCRNWTWSWAFINENARIVIFGAWDTATTASRAKILSEGWQTSSKGRTQPGYGEALEYLRRVEDGGYALFTFPMEFSEDLRDADGLGPARIKGFTAKLSRKALMRIGTDWYAADPGFLAEIPEEIQRPELYWEGATRPLTVNAFERNRTARAACLNHHGSTCSVCGFDGTSVYGAVGKGVIHVHHVVPIAEINLPARGGNDSQAFGR